jgi:dihydrofolate reductase
MRKIITTTFVTLDGVMQAPGGPQEDTSGGFKYGGWMAGVQWDEVMGNTMGAFMKMPFELLLGRVTYDIFAGYWPTAKTESEVAVPFNANKKYVVSHSAFEPKWENTECISGDVVAELKRLKTMDAPDLWVHGSGNLIQTLLKEELVDEMHVWTHPVTIGMGKRLFAEGTLPRAWKMVDSKVSTTGVVIGTYRPAGELKTGTIGG